MRLTDLMSSLKLTVYPEIGLVIFVLVFAAIVVRTCLRGRHRDDDRMAAMPLEPDAAGAPQPSRR